MKFAVGYRLEPDKRFVDMMIKEKEHISEVYFSWGDFPNGRNTMLTNSEYSPFEIQTEVEKDLTHLSSEGLKFNLLFNGNCYGGDSLSRSLFSKIGDTVDYISGKFGLSSVTTTSPLIAKFVKENFPDIDLRASVNMSIGTVSGMDYVEKYFDSFYMQREQNRNLDAIKELTAWCNLHGKGLYLLANSGCLNNCSAHAFHDNLVSHETEISSRDNAYSFTGICHEYIENPEKRVSLVRDTSFIRPEEMYLYDEYFTSAKLATRVHPNPCAVLSAYISGQYTGAVTDLLEPSHSATLYPYIIDNSLLPKDFNKRILTCTKSCADCGFCERAYDEALVKIDE